MPVLPPAENVARAVMNFTYGGEPCANVLHFIADGNAGAPDEQELGSRLAVWWNAQMKGVVPTTLILNEIIVTDLSAESDPAFEYTTGLPSAGTNGGAQMPNNVALCISTRTAFRGRSYRGRIYHMGLREDMVTTNSISGASAADMRTRYLPLLNLAGDVGEPVFALVVLSYYANGALRSSPVATQVTEIVVNAQVDTMRRRMPR